MGLRRQNRKGGHVVYDPFREVLSKEDISAEDECCELKESSWLEILY